MNKKGRIFIISAPSGCGKTTLCKRLLKTGLGLNRSVSMTTRPRRPGEINGKDYYFVSKNNFQKRIKQNGFLEWTRTYGWYYGTPKETVTDLLGRGKDVLLSIDVKGAMNVKRLYRGAVLIFIAPPSIKELKERLTRRNLDDKKEIKKRLGIAKRELSYVERYDYCVTNDSISKAVSRLKAIVVAERLEYGRLGRSYA